MTESKLEYFLHRLGDSERKVFQAQLLESNSKSDQVLGRLMELIVKGEKSKEEIYQTLYPEKPVSLGNYRNLRSKLFTKLMDFLAYRQFLDSPEKTLFLARALNKMNATRYFPSLVKRYVSNGPKRLSLDQADIDNRLHAEFLQHEKSVEGRKGLPLEELIENSEEAFVAKMLYYALAHHEAHGMYKNLRETPPLKLWPSIMQNLENGNWQETPLVWIYYSLVKLVQEPDVGAHLTESKSLLTAFGAQIDRQEVQQMYTVALNHCIRTFNHGNEGYLPEIFHLYQEMLDRNLLVNNNRISAWHFKSIVGNAIRMKESGWAREFMLEYGKYLPAQFRENLLNYCQGMLAFDDGNFGEAESLMNQVLEDFEDPFFGLDARSWLLRIYYETKNETGMEALTNSFRLFIRRHRHLSSERLRNYQEFIRFYRRLTALAPGKTSQALKLQSEILDSPYHAGRNWLLEKLNKWLPETE